MTSDQNRGAAFDPPEGGSPGREKSRRRRRDPSGIRNLPAVSFPEIKKLPGLGRKLSKPAKPAIQGLKDLQQLPGRVGLRRVNPEELAEVHELLRGTLYEGARPATNDVQYSPQQIIDFCHDLGEAMVASGADVRSVESAIIAVSTTWNLAPLQLDVTGSSITLQYDPVDGPPFMKMRAIHPEGANLHRLHEIYQLIDDVLHDRHDMESAAGQLAEILASRRRWPSWVTDGAMGVLGFALTLLAGGTLIGAAAAFVMMNIILRFGRALGMRGIPLFYVTIAQAVVIAAAGTLVLWQGWLPPSEISPPVAACVLLLLPHPVIVTLAQDIIGGYAQMSLTRGLLIAIIVVSVLFGIPIGMSLIGGQTTEVDVTDVEIHVLPLWLALIFSAIAAAANAFAQSASARIIPLSIGVSIVTAFILQVLIRYAGTDLLAGTFVAAVFLGAMSTVAAVHVRTHTAVIAVPAFCGALLPAPAVATALLNVMAEVPGATLEFGAAVLTTLAIGAGMVLGNLLATPGARRSLRRAHRVHVQSVHTDTTPIQVVRPHQQRRP